MPAPTVPQQPPKQPSRRSKTAQTGTQAARRRKAQSKPKQQGLSETQPATMDAAYSPAPSTSYHNLSLAQAVVTHSVDAVLVWLSAAIKSSSSSTTTSSSYERPAAAAPSRSAPPSPPPPPPEKTAVLDMDAVLEVMGAGPASVGFEEAAALFEEEEATVEEARAAFAVFDQDGDGFIDAGELGSVLRSLGFGSDAEDCRRMIDAYDEDRDGRISFHEFVKLMEQ